MAGSKADYLENLSLDLILGATPSGWTRPAALNTVKLKLYTTSPGDATGGTEATGGGYAALSITNNGTNFGAAASGVKSNATALEFTTFTGSVSSGSNIVGWAITDNSDNRLYWGDLAAGDQKAYTTNDQFTVPIGSLTITEE